MTDMDQTFEALLRFTAASILTVATLYLTYTLFTRQVRPRFVWGYLLLVMALKTILRWFLFLSLVNTLPQDWDDTLATWQVPMNQSLYIMMGFAVILLVRSHIVGRRVHYAMEHDDGDE